MKVKCAPLLHSSGEEGKTEEEAQNQYHFAHITDVLLFFAPPATLDKLPAEARRRGLWATQTKLLTREKIQVAVDAAKGSPRQMRRRRNPAPIFVLSKADQLSEATGFPLDVLKPRRYDRGVRGNLDLNAEADELVPYIIDKGGNAVAQGTKLQREEAAVLPSAALEATMMTSALRPLPSLEHPTAALTR